MLSLDTKRITRVELPTRKDYFLLICLIRANSVKHLILSYLTESEEKDLDNDGLVILKRPPHKDILVDIKNVFCYGIVDFNKGSEDYEHISSIRALDTLTDLGISLPSRYDYNTHSADALSGRILHYDTFDFGEICQYAHGFLGKPERCILFEKTIR